MSNLFLKKSFSNFNQHQLFEILRDTEAYQPEAVEAAKQIAQENGWFKEIENLISKEIIKEKEEIKDKAAYYRKAVEFQNQKNSFQVRISDIPKLEGALAEAGIDYFTENKNVGVLLDNYPTQTYYFQTKDLDKVDEITKSIGLRSPTYVDPQPFFRFEAKVLFIIAIVVIIVISLLSFAVTYSH